MQPWIALGFFLAAVCVAGSDARAQSSPTTKTGVYTLQQANRGSDVFAGSCRSCHTPETHTGPDFAAKWNGRTLADLFTVVQQSMPQDAPGALTDQEYADVLAYMLRMNRLPAGSRELPANPDALKTIRIEVATTP